MNTNVPKITETSLFKPGISEEIQKQQAKLEQKRKTYRQELQSKALQEEGRRKVELRASTDKYLKEVLHIPDTASRRLSYSVNKELNEVVVKVIDSETDKVIRVIPSEALIKLHSRMKEVIGLIFDEEI